MIKGYALTADMQDRRCFFLFGGGSNGKSGDIKLTRSSMEGFFTQASKHVIIKGPQQKANESSPHLEACKRKRCIAIPETDKGDRVHSSQVKSFCSGGEDAIQSRNLFQTMEMWDPYLKPFVACNYTVLIDSDDCGMRDRTSVVAFNSRFYDSNMQNSTITSNTVPTPPESVKADDNFDENDWVDPQTNLRWIKITADTTEEYRRMRKEHLDEYFAFLCAGACLALHHIKKLGRIQVPKVVQQHTQRFLDANDQMSLFISDCLFRTSVYPSLVGDGFNTVYLVYRAWLNESSRKHGYSRQTFRDCLIRSCLYDAKKQNGFYRTKLKIDEDKLQRDFPGTYQSYQFEVKKTSPQNLQSQLQTQSQLGDEEAPEAEEAPHQHHNTSLKRKRENQKPEKQEGAHPWWQ